MAFYGLQDVVAPPQYFNFATDVVDRWADHNPALEALQWANDDNSEAIGLSYRHFSLASKKAASLLVDLGATVGDRVFFMLNRVPAWWELATAVLRAGLVLCPCTTLATAKDIEFRLKISGATVFIGNRQSLLLLSKIRSQCPNVRIVLQADGIPTGGALQYREAVKTIDAASFQDFKTKSEDPALIYFTSGTTGPPKMVLHSHVTYPLAHVNTAKHWLELGEGKVYWNLAEQGWAKAAWSWFSTWNAGATLFVHDSKAPFTPDTTLKVLAKYPITTLCAPPTAYRQLVTLRMQKLIEVHPPKALSMCVGGGEPLNPSVIESWKSMMGVEIRDGYGQTETVLLVCNAVGMRIKPGSMGKPVPGIPVEIINDSGGPCPVSQEGDIAVLAVDSDGKQSPFLYRGYISNDGQITRELRPRQSSQGGTTGQWYVTGDRGYKDNDGYIWFVGRSDDVINSSGYRIGPFEVESTLKLHPAVVESAVIGLKDASRGEIVKAYVVLDPTFRDRDTPSLVKELQEHCKREAAPYKYPRSIEFVASDWLPKTTSGRFRRNELRSLAREETTRAHI